MFIPSVGDGIRIPVLCFHFWFKHLASGRVQKKLKIVQKLLSNNAEKKRSKVPKYCGIFWVVFVTKDSVSVLKSAVKKIFAIHFTSNKVCYVIVIWILIQLGKKFENNIENCTVLFKNYRFDLLLQQSHLPIKIF